MADGRVEIEVTVNGRRATEEINRVEVNVRTASANMSEEMEAAFEQLISRVSAAAGSMDSVSDSVNRLADEMSNTSERTQQTGGTMQHVMGNLVASAIQKCVEGAVELGKKVFETGVSFESAFAGVLKTVNFDDATISAEEMKQSLKDMAANEIPASFEELAGIAEASGQLGIATDNILDFTSVMAQMGTATNLSSEEAATSLAKFANITGMSADNYENLGSTIVALGNSFATTEADIVAMSTRLAATGSAAGMSETDILGFATAMSSVGIEAEAGGSSMSTFIKEMQTAVETGEGLEQFAMVAGMSAEEFAAAWKDDAAGAVVSFVSGLGQAEQRGSSVTAVLEEMGFTEVNLSNALIALSGNSELLANAVSTAGNAWEENTALANESAQRYETVESKLTMTQNAFSNLAETLYSSAAPMGEIIDEIKGYILQLDEAAKNGGFEAFAEEIGGVLAEALTSITEALPDIVSVAFTVVETLVEGILKNARNITQAAVDIVLMLAQGLTDCLPTLVPAVVDAVMVIATTLLQNVGVLIEAAKDILVALGEGIANALPLLIMRLPEFMASLGDALIQLIPLLLEVPLQIGQAMGKALVEFDWKETAEDVFDGMLQRLEEQAERCKTYFAEFFRTLGGKSAEEFESGAEEYSSGKSGKKTLNREEKPTEPEETPEPEAPAEVEKNNASANAPKPPPVVEDKNKISEEFKKDYEDLQMRLTKGEIAEGEEYFAELEKLLADHQAENLSAYNRYYKEIKDGRKKLAEAERKAAEKAAKDRQQELDRQAKAAEKAENERIKKVQAAAKTEISEAKKTVSEIVKTYQSKMSEVNKLIDSYKNKLLSVGDAFSTETHTDKFGNTLNTRKIADFDGQIKAMEDYDASIRKLKEQGASEEFISELTSSNDFETGAKFAEDISKMSEADRQAVFNGYKRREEAAQRLAENAYAGQVSEIESGFIAEIEAAFGELPDGMRELGKTAIDEFIEGLSDGDVIGAISGKADEIFSALSEAAAGGVFNSLDSLLSDNSAYYDELAAKVEAIVEAHSAAVSAGMASGAVTVSAENSAVTKTSDGYSKAEIDRLIETLNKPVTLQLDGKPIANFVIGYANNQGKITGGAVIK